MTALHLRAAGACDLDCVFCSFPDRALPFSLPRLMEAAGRSRARLVQVSGGEPLLLPAAGLTALLSWLKRGGRLVELQTNAVRAAELAPARLRALAALVDCFNVNFSADGAALDRAVTGRAGAFARRLRGVKALCATGRPVRLTFVVCRTNLAAAPRFPGFVARRLPGVGWLQFSLAKGQGKAALRRGLLPSYAEAGPAFTAALSECARLGLRAQADHIPPCFLPGFEHLHVDAEKVRRGLPGPHLAEKARRAECRGCRRPCPGPRRDHFDAP